MKTANFQEQSLKYVYATISCSVELWSSYSCVGNSNDVLAEYDPIFWARSRDPRFEIFPLKQINLVVDNLLFDGFSGNVERKITSHKDLIDIFWTDRKNLFRSDVNVAMQLFKRIQFMLTDYEERYYEFLWRFKIHLYVSKNNQKGSVSEYSLCLRRSFRFQNWLKLEEFNAQVSFLINKLSLF